MNPGRVVGFIAVTVALLAWLGGTPLHLTAGVLSSGSESPLRITEWMYSNHGMLADEEADNPDWIEIHNSAPAAIDLQDYGLSDELGTPLKWRFPRVVLGPNEYLVVFASGKDFTPRPGPAPAVYQPVQPDHVRGLRLWLDATEPASLVLNGSSVQEWRDRRSVPRTLSPQSMTGLVLWLDAADPNGVVVEDGGVSRWIDKSGSTHDAVQPIAGARPVRNSASAPATLQFDGVDDVLSISRLSNIRTVFWVLTDETKSGTDLRPLLGDTNSYDFHRGNWRKLFDPKYAAQGLKSAECFVNGQRLSPLNDPLPAGRLVLSLSATGPARASLISSDRLINGRHWLGSLGEILVFDRILSDAERSAIEAYLSAKWNVPFEALGELPVASQSVPNAQPQFVLDYPGARPVVRFDGLDDHLAFSRIHGIQSVFWVAREDESASSNYRPLLGDTEFYDFHRGDDGILFYGDPLRPSFYNAGINGISVNPMTAPMPAVLSLIRAVEFGADARANLLGSDRVLEDRVWQGDFGEVLVYGRVLSAEEIVRVEAYLMRKWNLPVRNLHTNFKLSAAGENIVLSSPDGKVIDHVFGGVVPPNMSQGRSAEGGTAWKVFPNPTPGRANITESFDAALGAPLFSLPGGLYDAPIDLALTVPPPGAVHFTLDGSEPSASAPVWTGVRRVETNTVVRARVFSEGSAPGPLVTQSYLIGEHSSFATTSLVMDPANLFDEERGIYVLGRHADTNLPFYGANFWREWERPVHIEFFESDGNPGVSLNAGLRIHGGWSRAQPQKGLRIIARSRYGPSRIEYPFFPDKPIETFKQILLRSGGNDWVNTMFRDPVGQSICASMGLVRQAYLPTHVFINGRYWGIHKVREYVDEDWLGSNYGVDPDRIEIIENLGVVRAGDALAFRELVDFFESRDFRAAEDYDQLVARMDVENFIDYMIAQIYLDNTDWPENNVRCWRSTDWDGRWRWIPFDLDGAFDTQGAGPGTNTLSAVCSSREGWPARFLRGVLANDQFKREFIMRSLDRLNTALSSNQVLARIDAIYSRMAPEMAQHVQRWGGSEALGFVSFKSVEEWNQNVSRVRAFAAERTGYVQRHLGEFFSLGSPIGVRLIVPVIGGSVELNSVTISGSQGEWTGAYLPGLPLTIRAVPSAGYRFDRWIGLTSTNAVVTVTPTADLQVQARFVQVQPPDPVPHELAGGPYAFLSFPASSAAGTYPASMIFQQGTVLDPVLTTPLSGRWSLPYNLESRSRINGLGRRGISFINTGSTNVNGGFVGAAVLALNTVGCETVQVSWTGETLEPNEREYRIRCQYRIGQSGSFRDVLDGVGQPLEYARNPKSGHREIFGPFELPADAVNKPLIQIRWKYYSASTNSTGPRAELRLDDILVSGRKTEWPVRSGKVVINEIMYHPATNAPATAFIELLNLDTRRIQLAGWKLTDGVEFEFSDTLLSPGEHIVVVADRAGFRAAYPEVNGVFGPWRGRLNKDSERIELEDASGVQIDELTYADEGDWARREIGPLDHGYRGWIWSGAHDGNGRSLELVQPELSNQYGSNWRASIPAGGTPGAANSQRAENTPPLIAGVTHFPAIPRAGDVVTVTAEVVDENQESVQAFVWYRADGQPAFERAQLWDDGLHGDGAAGDQIFGVRLPAQPHGQVVEFYIAAEDRGGRMSSWPQPVELTNEQAANCLYQVDDIERAGELPIYRIILKESERAQLEAIGKLAWFNSSDAQMNGTFISCESGKTEIRYLTGVRVRGGSSRSLSPKNRRVNFAHDRPWQGVSAINLNGINPHSQVLGSALFARAGIAAALARPVVLLENNTNLAVLGGGAWAVHARVEVFDDAFVDQHFPNEESGTIWKAFGGDLSYLGPDLTLYGQPGFYQEETSGDDAAWANLAALTRVLSLTPGPDLAVELERVADIEEWLRYLAMNVLIANQETSLATGGEGDYALFSAKGDPRMELLPYDLDSVMGVAGGLNSPILQATTNAVLKRILQAPEFASRFYEEIERLASTVFTPEMLHSEIEHALGSFVPKATRDAIAQFAADRRAFVLAQIPRELSATISLPLSAGYYRTSADRLSFTGRADALRTRAVTVNGRTATWHALTGEWELRDLPLSPGINRLIVRAWGADGVEAQNLALDVWMDNSLRREYRGTLSSNQVWTAAAGPFWVMSNLLVPEGVTLEIRPGATVFVYDSVEIIVRGRLVAEGAPDQRIRFARVPGSQYHWERIQFQNSTNENRLSYVDFERPGARALYLTNSAVRLNHIGWMGVSQQFIRTEYSSLEIRNSVFPDITWQEPINGIGLPANGFYLIENNVFGTTIGYCDIVDFTGGKLPGAIPVFRNNIFLGGADDGLDLDGTDAYVEGNLFLNFIKDESNTSTGFSDAIATGMYNGETSHVMAFRNVFAQNDNDVLLKEGAFLTAQHNTFVGASVAALAFYEDQRNTAPPRGAALDGNIFWSSRALGNFDPLWLTNGVVSLAVNRSIVESNLLARGIGNLAVDPLFISSNDFRLRLNSPAHRAGLNGLDLGAYVPGGALIFDEPDGITPATEAVLRIAGLGLTHYRYRVNDGPYGAEFPIGSPLSLSGLTNGSYTVFVLGKNLAGLWQNEAERSVSHTWHVDTSSLGLHFNEVLAQNAGILFQGRTPDLVELHYSGREPLDLEGIGISDKRELPYKFVFPEGAQIQPGEHLVLEADLAGTSEGWFLGFSLRQTGDELILTDRADRGGPLLDVIQFGQQISGLSIGRVGGGKWGLTRPTFGAANLAHLTGTRDALRINEWLANAGGGYDDDFVEIYNPTGLPVDLTGLELSDSADGRNPYRIPELSFIGSYGFAVFLADGNNGESDHVSFQLAQEGGVIRLATDRDRIIDLVVYGPQHSGISEGRAPSGAGAFARQPPTPGSGRAPSSGPIRLNEILASAGGGVMSGNTDWIELYNPSTEWVSLEGMSLTDDPDQANQWIFPAGAQIAPGGFLVVACNNLQPPSATNTGFGLGIQGDSIHLFDSDARGGGILDEISFGLQAPGYSIGRDTFSSAWVLDGPTPGAMNQPAPLAPPSALRLNEWMARPASGDDWFELFNTEPQPVALAGLALTDNAADLRHYEIPALSFIGPLGFKKFIADEAPLKGAEHTNFKLSATGEVLILSDRNGDTIDAVEFGAQTSGISQGRLPDGARNRIASFSVPTPETWNFVDFDGDGMANEWESQNGFGILDRRDADLDTDGDGYTNREEYLSGTDPRDRASLLELSLAWPGPASGILEFNGVIGQSYLVQYRDSLGAGVWLSLRVVPPLSSNSVVRTSDTVNSSARFYRLISPAPLFELSR